MSEQRKLKLKPVLWIGSSKKDLQAMSADAKSDIGHSLRDVQQGKDPGNLKLLRHLEESGIWEIVVNDRNATFRAVYTVRFADAIVVLHVFQKKSKSGISTPKHEINLVLERFKMAKILYEEWKKQI